MGKITSWFKELTFLFKSASKTKKTFIILLTLMTFFFSLHLFFDLRLHCLCGGCCFLCYSDCNFTLGFPFTYYASGTNISSSAAGCQVSILIPWALLVNTMILLVAIICIIKNRYKSLAGLYTIFLILPLLSLIFSISTTGFPWRNKVKDFCSNGKLKDIGAQFSTKNNINNE